MGSWLVGLVFFFLCTKVSRGFFVFLGGLGWGGDGWVGAWWVGGWDGGRDGLRVFSWVGRRGEGCDSWIVGGGR